MNSEEHGRSNRLVSGGINATIAYDQSVKPYHKKIADLIDKPLDESLLKVLDVGCGTGNLLMCLSRTVANMDVTIVDIDQKCLDLCSQYEAVSDAILVESTLDLGKTGEGEYDVVIYSHVLQYEPNPLVALECLFSKLAPAGVLIIAVSNAITPTKITNNLFRRKYSEGYYTWDKSSLSNILGEVLGSEDIVEYHGDYVPLPLLYKYRFGQKIGMLFLKLFPWFAFSHIYKVTRKS